MNTLSATFRYTLVTLILTASLAGCGRQGIANSSGMGSARSSNKESALGREESADATARYQKARALVAKGAKEEAHTLLEQATAEFPENQDLHRVYAELLWDLSEGTDPNLLRKAAAEAVRAAEIGLRSNRVDYAVTSLLAQTLGYTKDRETLDRLFGRLLAKDPSSNVYLDYATGLVLLGDSKAEEAFKSALQSDPKGEAAARYGEWLLGQQREKDALAVLPDETPVYYIHFLRGLALERLDRPQEAQAAYDRYRNFSQTFPAPERFRIPGSSLQSGIRFQSSERTGHSS